MLIRKTTVSPTGEKQEQLIMDPLGHRMHNPITAPWSNTLSERFPGMVNSKTMMFGHHPKKEVERLTLNAQAAAALYDLARAQPSISRIADSFFVGHVEVPLELWMGADGAAIGAENTKTTRNINREEKTSRWRR
jgi:hypothetical protein